MTIFSSLRYTLIDCLLLDGRVTVSNGGILIFIVRRYMTAIVSGSWTVCSKFLLLRCI